MAKLIPEGYTSVTPYLYVKSAAEAIALYEKAFGARELFRLTMPGGGVAHAEIQIGDAKLMLADEMPEWGNKSPLTTGSPTCGFMIYVEDCDAAFANAIAAGCTEKRPVEDQFYGDRAGTVICPFGHQWSIGTHVKDMSADEMQVAMDEMMKSMA